MGRSDIAGWDLIGDNEEAVARDDRCRNVTVTGAWSYTRWEARAARDTSLEAEQIVVEQGGKEARDTSLLPLGKGCGGSLWVKRYCRGTTLMHHV